MNLLEPKTIEILNSKGQAVSYIITKIPAIPGREIAYKYPVSGLPKLGDYAVNEETMFKLISYVGVPRGDKPPLMLTTQELINNHIDCWETLLKLEKQMLEYNCSFLAEGKTLTFFEGIVQKFLTLTTKILTDFLRSYSKREKPPSMN